MIRKNIVEEAYQVWLRETKGALTNVLYPHPCDDQRFYKFTKIVMKKSRDRKYNSNWLEKKLKQDLPGKAYNSYIKRYVNRFDTIFNYERGILR